MITSHGDKQRNRSVGADADLRARSWWLHRMTPEKVSRRRVAMNCIPSGLSSRAKTTQELFSTRGRRLGRRDAGHSRQISELERGASTIFLGKLKI
jgi:hypothetical protein